MLIHNKHVKYLYLLVIILPLQIRSVARSCPTLCDPTNLSTPGLPVHHQIPVYSWNLALLDELENGLITTVS